MARQQRQEIEIDRPHRQPIAQSLAQLHGRCQRYRLRNFHRHDILEIGDAVVNVQRLASRAEMGKRTPARCRIQHDGQRSCRNALCHQIVQLIRAAIRGIGRCQQHQAGPDLFQRPQQGLVVLHLPAGDNAMDRQIGARFVDDDAIEFAPVGIAGKRPVDHWHGAGKPLRDSMADIVTDRFFVQRPSVFAKCRQEQVHQSTKMALPPDPLAGIGSGRDAVGNRDTGRKSRRRHQRGTPAKRRSARKAQTLQISALPHCPARSTTEPAFQRYSFISLALDISPILEIRKRLNTHPQLVLVSIGRTRENLT